MKRFIIFELLFSLALCYTMEPEQNVSSILCTHDSIHRDLLIQHTVKCGLDPEESKKWQTWKDVPNTIQDSICNYYYDTQYQLYKNGCQKKGWTNGSVPSLLKFIGTPFDANTPYNNVPTIEKVRSLMPQICLLKKMASVIPFELQENLIKPLLDGIPYVTQHQISTIQPLICSTEKNKNNPVSALICNQNSIFVGFYNGEIQKWDYEQSRSEPTYSYQAHSRAVNALLATGKYLISGAESIKVRMQENGMVYRVIPIEKTIHFLCLIDKELLASASNASNHSTISVWNFKKGEIKYNCNLPTFNIDSFSFFDNSIIIAGRSSLFLNGFAGKNYSLFFFKKNLNLIKKYCSYHRTINSIQYYGKGNLITCGENGIVFSRITQEEHVAFLRFCLKDAPCYNFIDLNCIVVYNTKNSIKVFKYMPNNKDGYLSHTLQYNSSPTKLTPFQDGFVSGHSNGDIIVWKPSEPFETWYKKNSASQVALLQYAYQPNILTNDCYNDSLCSIQ